MIVFILIFSIFSSILTFFAMIAFFIGARKHYKQIFAESFMNFVVQLNTDKLTWEEHQKYAEYVQSILTKGCSNYSVEKYLLDSHQIHHKRSEFYASIFQDLQHHKMKVFLTSLLG